MPKNRYIPQVKKTSVQNLDVRTINDLQLHLYVLVLRKSVKLKDFIKAYDNRKDSRNAIIRIKYELSKCRPEVLSILLAMAKNPARFEFEFTVVDNKFLMNDTEHDIKFRIYCGYHGSDYTVSINHKEFLSKHECQIMWYVARSLYKMRENEYRLADELKNLEEAEKVFEIYQQEKEGQ